MPTVTNYKEEFTSLAYGQCYLFKGNTNKLSWFLRGQPNVNVFRGNNLGQIANFITYEPTNYIVYINKAEKVTLPSEKIYINKLIRVFICFCLEDGLSESEKKLYKKYESENYTVINYSSINLINEKCLVELYKKSFSNYKDLDKKIIQTKLKEYQHYPLTYEQLLLDLKSINTLIDPDYIVVPDLILELCKTKSFSPVLKFRNLSRNILESYFNPPFRGFIEILSKDYSKDFKFTTGLYTWYKYFYFKYALKWNYDVSFLVLIFFTWVYKSTVVYPKFGKAGLTMFKPNGARKNYNIIYFSPSVEAIDLLNNL